MPPAKKKKACRKDARKPLLLLLVLFLFVSFTLGAAFFFIFLGPPAPGPQDSQPHLTYEQSPAIREFSAPPTKKQPPKGEIPAAPPQRRETKKYNIAIVIDDMGYQKKLGRQFIALDLPLSFSFLPHAPFTDLLVSETQQKKKDILLHLPLEPHDPTWDLGPGAIRTAMTDAEIGRIFAEDLTFVPKAIGVNNHMGSKFTEDRRAMASLLQQLKNHRLFFLDSITSANSIGFELAAEMQLDAARRNVFLDNVEETTAILAQLDTLAELARLHGDAIGIGHPKAATLEALRQFSRKIPPDIKVVAIHQLVQ